LDPKYSYIPQIKELSCESPPIARRILEIQADIDESKIATARAEFGNKIKNFLPNSRTVFDWGISIPHDTSGYPLFEHMESNVDLVDVWESEDLTKICNRLITRKKSLQLIAENKAEYAQKFSDLESLSNTILPEWANSFAVTKIKKISLVYINEINKRNFPTFIMDNGEIPLAKILKLFHGHQLNADLKLLPPYEHSVNYLVDQQKNSEGGWYVSGGSKLESKGRGEERKGPDAALDLILTASLSALEGKDNQQLTWNFPNVKHNIESLHGLISDLFCSIFTEEALKSFGTKTGTTA